MKVSLPWAPIIVIFLLASILAWIIHTIPNSNPTIKEAPKDTVYTHAKVVTVENNDTLYIITLDKQ